MTDFEMPDQRSTTAQLEDVASWASTQELGEAAAWVLDPKLPKPSPVAFMAVLTWTLQQKMYDASDCLKRQWSRS